MKGQSVTGVCSAVVTSAAVRWQRWFLPLCLCASLGININNRAASSFFIFSHQVFIAHVQQNSGFPNDRYRLPTAISSRNSSGKSIVLFWLFKKKENFFSYWWEKGSSLIWAVVLVEFVFEYPFTALRSSSVTDKRNFHVTHHAWWINILKNVFFFLFFLDSSSLLQQWRTIPACGSQSGKKKKILCLTDTCCKAEAKVPVETPFVEHNKCATVLKMDFN